ncbi:Tetratricopeptide-like helical [Penicillium italicum]|uniref:Tetratricopeptide-like helical n=1 Tax=Penicillium italicum TaxID=40296 RepID=A0A0A2L4H8_PENIT|nr:Tetratricopeptide-like helical [Penicillium italicum]
MEFLQFTGIEGHLEEVKEIGNRLGGLPLALAQMTGIIRLGFLTYSEFLRLYNEPEEAADIHDTVLQPLRKTARGNLSTIWAFEQLSDTARILLEISSFLNPDCIQEDLLTKFATNVNNPSYPKKRGLFFAARKQLIGASLFRHNQETKEYWMHRVTQDVTRAKVQPEQQLKIFLSVVCIILEAWPTQGVGDHDITLWNKCEALCPHVISLQDAYSTYFARDDAWSRVEFSTLLSRAGWYQHSRGQSHLVRPLLETALKICPRRNCETDRDLESDILYTLGAIANETNDAEGCMKYTMNFFKIRVKVAEETGEVDERLARSHNQIGIPLMMFGKYQEAEEAFSTSAQKYEDVPNYTKDKRSLPLVNLGLAYWLQGRLERASEVLELGLADREELYGSMDNYDFRTGRFLYALGNVRFSQGLLGQSEEFHRRALQQFQSTIGNHHHRTADVCHRMAQHCLRKGLLDEATRLFRSAASMRRKLTVLRPDEMDLTEHDFDCLVTFWSR